jgi:CTP:molybdopterin cytidylyltransferase MocA
MIEERGEGVESGERGSLWAVVLAGGEGFRLRPLVRHVCGDERPKQFSPLLGARTLLGLTLDRVGLRIPPERTVVVTLQAHARYVERDLGEKLHPHVLSQPENRGTAAAAAAAEQEAVANAKQIAAAIEPYYGKAASEKLFGLLAGHYGAVKQYLEATVAGSKDKQDAAYTSVSGNASEIARFLSGANPNLPFDTLNGLLLAHGGRHAQQIRHVQGKQYAQEAQTWEAMKSHMYVIADALAGAIAKQFPRQFS